MATITLSNSFSFLDAQDWAWDVTQASASRLVITDGIHTQIFSGRFVYSGETVTGLVSSSTFQLNGKTVYTATGLSKSMAILAEFALTEGDTLETYEYVLSGNDTLRGSAGADTLYGFAGDDLIDGRAGADIMVGGAGHDTYVVDNVGDQVIELVNEGTDTVNVAIAQKGGSYTLGANIENGRLVNKVAFDLIGNSLANHLVGNAAANRLDGGLGADTMEGGAGNDTYVVDNVGDIIKDTAGIDTVEASISYELKAGLENLVLTGSDAISGTGNTAANVLDGSQNSAANRLVGGKGNDTYIIGAGDTVFEELNQGTDLVKSYVSHTLGANVENLTLLGTGNLDGTGNNLKNIIIGNSGNNRLDGGDGVDRLSGGAGDDTYVVDLTAANKLQDTIIERAREGNDSLEVRGGTAGLGSKTIVLGANLENLDVSGTNAGVKLNLTGNALDNILVGNSSQNVFTGGRGNDVFRFDSVDQLGNDVTTRDTIRDFKSGQDRIDLSSIGNFQLIDSNSAFTGAYQLKLVDGVLNGTLDGDANTDFQIVLTGVKSLSQSDFVHLA